jgi:hypothetical protein
MNNESTSVPVDNKNFVGIGKLIFDSDAEWNIPILHFMVDKTASGNYEATLLEFGLVSWSENLNGAIRSLVKQTHSHIFTVLLRTGFDQFIKDVDNYVMDEYWRQYRKMDFSLAREGKDLSHQMDNVSIKEMKAIISEERKNFLLELAKDNAENMVDEFEKMPSLSGYAFEEIKDAA